MITRVLDSRGGIVHDCVQAHCDVSWDGYLIATGEPVTGRASHDPAVWDTVDEHTVRLISTPE